MKNYIYICIVFITLLSCNPPRNTLDLVFDKQKCSENLYKLRNPCTEFRHDAVKSMYYPASPSDYFDKEIAALSDSLFLFLFVGPEIKRYEDATNIYLGLYNMHHLPPQLSKCKNVTAITFRADHQFDFSEAFDSLYTISPNIEDIRLQTVCCDSINTQNIPDNIALFSNLKILEIDYLLDDVPIVLKKLQNLTKVCIITKVSDEYVFKVFVPHWKAAKELTLRDGFYLKRHGKWKRVFNKVDYSKDIQGAIRLRRLKQH
jgi:hypothetical protein